MFEKYFKKTERLTNQDKKIDSKEAIISTDSLLNPDISLDRNMSGEYGKHINEAYYFLNRIQDSGFWSFEQAEAYASDYPKCENASEVMEKNSFVKAIIEDSDQVIWDYPDGENNLLGKIDSIKNIEQLDESVKILIGDGSDLSVTTEEVFKGLYRLNIKKELETGLIYNLSINIDQKNKKITFLAFQPVSELRVGFSDEIKSNEFIKKIFELNPRTNIQVSEQTRKEVELKEQRLLDAMKNELLLQERYKPEELSGWTTTNPLYHNEDNYRYIIHAVTNEEQSKSLEMNRLAMIKEGEEMEKIQEGSVFDDPENFLKRRFISTSIIDEVHRGLWSQAGVILDVPEGNIIKANSHDIGSIPNERILKTKEQQLLDASQILKETSKEDYNEIVVSGYNPDNDEESKISGVFIVMDIRTGKAKNEELSSKAKRFAKENSLPIVEINEPVI